MNRLISTIHFIILCVLEYLETRNLRKIHSELLLYYNYLNEMTHLYYTNS